MARQVHLQITGRFGNMILYKRGDTYCARTAPARVRQTKATKKSAGSFGKASGMGKCLRQQLMPVIPFPADPKMQARLVSALFQWTRQQAETPSGPMPFIGSFQFTEGATVSERWKVPLQVTFAGPGMAELKIPAFVPSKAIAAPAGTASITCHIAAAGCDVLTGVATGACSTSVDYHYNDAEVTEQLISIPVPTPAGSLVVTAVFLEYKLVKNGHVEATKNKAFMPAGVIDARCV